MLVYFSIAAPLPVSSFERMSADAEAREKERLERLKMLVFLTSS
jgi:hypothetical protein